MALLGGARSTGTGKKHTGIITPNRTTCKLFTQAPPRPVLPPIKFMPLVGHGIKLQGFMIMDVTRSAEIVCQLIDCNYMLSIHIESIVTLV